MLNAEWAASRGAFGLERPRTARSRRLRPGVAATPLGKEGSGARGGAPPTKPTPCGGWPTRNAKRFATSPRSSSNPEKRSVSGAIRLIGVSTTRGTGTPMRESPPLTLRFWGSPCSACRGACAGGSRGMALHFGQDYRICRMNRIPGSVLGVQSSCQSWESCNPVKRIVRAASRGAFAPASAGGEKERIRPAAPVRFR